MKNKHLCLALSSLIALGGISNANAIESYIPRPSIFHKVVKGDTLIRLAERYLLDGSLNDELAIYLGRSNPDYIYIGETLEIPDKQVLLGNVEAPDKYGCTPVDFDNPKDLNNKYYEMKEGDNFNGVYYKIYQNILKDNPNLANGLSHIELRRALYLFNNVTDEWNMPIGTKVYLMNDEYLLTLTNNLISTHKLTKKR